MSGKFVIIRVHSWSSKRGDLCFNANGRECAALPQMAANLVKCKRSGTRERFVLCPRSPTFPYPRNRWERSESVVICVFRIMHELDCSECLFKEIS